MGGTREEARGAHLHFNLKVVVLVGEAIRLRGKKSEKCHTDKQGHVQRITHCALGVHQALVEVDGKAGLPSILGGGG